MRRPWTKADDQYMREHYPNTDTYEVADILCRTLRSVWARAKTLGLKKTAEYLASPGRHRLQKNHNQGKATQFKKGHTPWNTGLKGIKVHPNAQATQFKKGQLPPNTLEDGVVTLRHPHKNRGGKPYYFIRIAAGKWEQYHRYLWIENHGEIPEGMIVVFRDGNTLNCTIENLELITRQENMARNTKHKYPKELQEAIILKNKLNKLIHEK